ncbi:heart- and neural crest derivatives-expressed protein 1 isoform X2 [Hyperolius riggenbachi]|uniref:heart- and neural crest derivatives-expressed protein 1 isoform X2 n=1 Tax=Hyperolius riggenbachi TaxID=752182 RepID=UPI0035A37FB3
MGPPPLLTFCTDDPISGNLYNLPCLCREESTGLQPNTRFNTTTAMPADCSVNTRKMPFWKSSNTPERGPLWTQGCRKKGRRLRVDEKGAACSERIHRKHKVDSAIHLS